MLEEKIYTIGRGAECDIRLDDPSVSEVHAQVQLLADGKLSIVDRDSTNGSFFFDGSQWREFVRATVNPTARLRFGNCERVASQLVVAPRAEATVGVETKPAAALDREPKPLGWLLALQQKVGLGSVDLQRLFSFKGRINRKRYWLSYAAFIGVVVAIGLLSALISVALGTGVGLAALGPGADLVNLAGVVVGGLLLLFLLVAGVFMVWFLLALYAKRLHDRNRSGWFMALGIPGSVWLLLGSLNPHLSDEIWFLLGILVLHLAPLWFSIECAFLRGTVGPNRFGEDPLAQPAR